MPEPIVEFDHFSFQYNAQAEPTLHDINLKIYPGEKVLIAGSSGCGKSTKVNCINGLIPFTYKGTIQGSLRINGKATVDQSIAELSDVVGTVLQDTDSQFVGMTVLEDIAFVLENECVSQAEMYDRVKRAAEIVGIQDHLVYSPNELSGGQRQRVSIAGVMVDDVPLLLFDEPLANLDPATGKSAIQLIDDIQKQTGATVIIVEHRIEDVLYCDVDRIILVDDGRIIFDGSTDELLAGDLLTRSGLREPLYVTALKYAGVELTEEMHPSSISRVAIPEEGKEKVRNWYSQRNVSREEKEKQSLLSLNSIKFAYDNKPLTIKGVDLDIGKGELVAIVGKNGAGKTTLAKLICGFEKPSDGEITLEGEDLLQFSIKERADRIGYVMQNPNKMISQVMIFDEVALGLRSRKVEEDVIREKVENILKVCGLYEFREWPISALSYGQRKRVTIAAILVLDPKIIILDEPTAGQDFRHYTDIMEFLRSLRDLGITIIMITHDMHLMLEYAERSIVLCDGEIIADTSSADLLTDLSIVKLADLKETSLYDLALRCGIDDATAFVQCFIDYDREVRSHGI